MLEYIISSYTTVWHIMLLDSAAGRARRGDFATFQSNHAHSQRTPETCLSAVCARREPASAPSRSRRAGDSGAPGLPETSRLPEPLISGCSRRTTIMVGMLGHFLIPNHKDQKCPSIPTITIFVRATSIEARKKDTGRREGAGGGQAEGGA